MTISVLLLTLNEESNLPHCLAALDWCDDVVVLDSFSTDNTLEVADSYGARVVQRRFDSFAGQRNFGLDTIEFKHEWILHLDADEIVTPALVAELQKVVREGDKCAYQIAPKLMFMGRWLRHSSMYPCYQVRFGRADKLRFVQVGHGQRESLGPEQIGVLREGYLHYSVSKGIADWFERHNRYSTDEARQCIELRQRGFGSLRSIWRERDRLRRRRRLKELSIRLPFRPFLRFMHAYIWHRGVLDGGPGFLYCQMLAAYEFMITSKVTELRYRDSAEGISAQRPALRRVSKSESAGHAKVLRMPEAAARASAVGGRTDSRRDSKIACQATEDSA